MLCNDKRNHACTVYAAEDPVFLPVQPVDEHDLSLLEREAECIRKKNGQSFGDEIAVTLEPR